MQMNFQIVVTRRSGSAAGYGGQPTGEWVTVKTVWGRVVSVKGTGKAKDGQLIERQTLRAWLPTGTGVKIGDRLIVGAITYRALTGSIPIYAGAAVHHEDVNVEVN